MPVSTDRPPLLADAAISLIAGNGIRALTHRAVDAAAQVPTGTTSYHFRTRRDLVRGILVRIARLNVARLAGLPGPSTDLDSAPVTRQERLAEAEQLAERAAAFVDGQIGEHRDRTLARMACQIEVASDPDLSEILHAGGQFRTMAIAAVTRLGATDPTCHADGLISLLDGLQYDRLVGLGSLTAATPGTARSRSEIAVVVRAYLVGLVPR